MKKPLLFLLFALLITSHVSAQDIGEKREIAKNALFFEVAGQGLAYSLNYDRILFIKGIFSSSIRVGITPLVSRNGFPRNGQLFGLLNCYIGRSKYKFEIGVGVDNHFNFDPAISYKDYRKGYLYKQSLWAGTPWPSYNIDVTSQISFRHEINKEKWFYRISFICSDQFGRDGWGNVTQHFLPWGGVSIGKSF